MSASVVTSHVMATYKRWPVRFVSGRGALLYDDAGREYVDLLAGIAVASVGHCHPVVTAAIRDQSERLMHVSNLFHTDPQESLAAHLAAVTGGKLSFFCNSGAEAIEAAVKLVRRWARATKGTGAHRIVCATGGFHGRTLGALAATGQPAKQEPFAPMLEGFTHVAYGDTAAIADALGDDVAAVLLEPVQGEAGVIVPPSGYLTEVAALCRAAGALLVADEVQTGLGRTGRWFGYEHDGAAPDIVCLAKALGGGLPIGACLADPEIATAFEPGDHASTFGGGLVQCAAAGAVLRVIEQENLVERAALLGERTRAHLRAALGDAVEVRGRGLLIGIELHRPAARAVVEAALERRVVVNDATPNVVRIAPPLVITDDEMDRACDSLVEVIHAL